MSVQNLSFTEQVEAWVRESEKRMLTVFHESVQDLVEEMQKVGPSVASTKAAAAASKGKKQGPPATGDGGNMPVDLGFLRASLRISTQSPMPMTAKAPGTPVSYNPEAVVLAIANAKLGDVLFAAYTAVYAARVNYGFEGEDSLGRSYNQRGYQFVGMAAMKWPKIVRAAVQRVKDAGI